MSEVAELIDKAADYLEEHGHCKGTYRDEYTGAVCADGALQAATGAPAETNGFRLLDGPSFHLYDPADRAVREYLRETRTELDLDGRILIWWNDQDGRSKEEVVTLFRTVAAKLREEEGE